MPLKKYGVLKGTVVKTVAESDFDTPHYQVQVNAGGKNYRIAVNVRSQESPSELLFLVNEQFQHPILAGLAGLAEGFNVLAPGPGGLALDYIRGNLFDHTQMRPLPFNIPGPDNDLNEMLELYLHRAQTSADAMIYAFGEPWGPEENEPDKVFHFQPGNGIHDIHMNQGSKPGTRFVKFDGVWQDGGLLLHFPSTQQWVAIFLAFQSQAWHTDDVTGRAFDEIVVKTDGIVHIIGALANPVGPAPEKEIVTLLNTSPQAVNLTGWQIADRMKNKQELSGSIPAGGTMAVSLSKDVQLGNKGGIITLLDAQGLKVDGVSYTGEQAKREGWTIAF